MALVDFAISALSAVNNHVRLSTYQPARRLLNGRPRTLHMPGLGTGLPDDEAKRKLSLDTDMGQIELTTIVERVQQAFVQLVEGIFGDAGRTKPETQ